MNKYLCKDSNGELKDSVELKNMKCTNDGKCHCMCDVTCDKCDCCIEGHWNGPDWKVGKTIQCSENRKLVLVFRAISNFFLSNPLPLLDILRTNRWGSYVRKIVES